MCTVQRGKGVVPPKPADIPIRAVKQSAWMMTDVTSAETHYLSSRVIS